MERLCAVCFITGIQVIIVDMFGRLELSQGHDVLWTCCYPITYPLVNSGSIQS